MEVVPARAGEATQRLTPSLAAPVVAVARTLAVMPTMAIVTMAGREARIQVSHDSIPQSFLRRGNRRRYFARSDKFD